MRYLVRFALAGIVVLILTWKLGMASHASSQPGAPVLIELFTSEGCSSCPPADALLTELDRSDPDSVVVLSEHVDYWNQLGWKDPYSSHWVSARQNTYAGRFGLSTVYTPQMVVDGNTEFTGSDQVQAQRAIQSAQTHEKIAVRIVSALLDKSGVTADIEVGPWLASAKPADIYIAAALDHAESQVARGENAGRKLQHVAVVRSLIKIGSVSKDPFARQIRIPIEPVYGSAPIRVVAFVQETGQGKVLGAAMRKVGP